ncbi:MAG: hypothetical protein IK029_01895 [Oscillospiraceae bacterium]|nr:hypothetical protein [Oscillospiraceae bacterium]
MISELKTQIMEEIREAVNCASLPEDGWTDMSFPGIIKLMKFRVDRYSLEGFGKLMTMHTTTKMGMELLTMSFMPSNGLTVPYLLMDAMSMKNKRCVFVEYYGCGRDDLQSDALEELYETFRLLPDYAEKPKWYVGERESYSLIKSGTEKQLTDMAVRSVKAYLSLIPLAHEDEGYKEQLAAFRQRMITEGNPSSSTLHLLLGKIGAERFMKQAVMPIDGEELPEIREKRGNRWLV